MKPYRFSINIRINKFVCAARAMPDQCDKRHSTIGCIKSIEVVRFYRFSYFASPSIQLCCAGWYNVCFLTADETGNNFAFRFYLARSPNLDWFVISSFVTRVSKSSRVWVSKQRTRFRISWLFLTRTTAAACAVPSNRVIKYDNVDNNNLIPLIDGISPTLGLKVY